MRRTALFIVSALLLIGSFAQAQEAFYIYRNDNNFNGFFYDEVIRMECSKFGLDSVEHDEFVVQDIVLADTIYRIPLSAIDSISFVQPEIRFQPGVRFIGNDGYSPYLKSIGVDGTTLRFEDLPDELIPEEGQVLLGMPNDPIAETVYKENDTTRNSFGCVVKKVKKSSSEPGVVIVEGEPVTDYQQVFDQYITVERVLMDDKGNVIERRIAGCTPDGMPRAKNDDDVEVGSYPLIDLTGKFSKEWGQDGDQSKVDLNVDVRFQLILRASYNVSKWACFAKLTTDVIINAKASVGLNINAGFEKKGRIFHCLPLYFPQPCCIFMFNPAPYIFARGQGMLRFSLNLPSVRLGLGADYSFMPLSPLPLRASMHWVEPTKEEKEAAEKDSSPLFSGDATLEGYLQAGIMFNLSIATADWLEYFISSSVGIYLYAGPKLTGHMKISTDMWGGNTVYNAISEQYLSFSWISASLEAKAEYWLPALDNDGDPETITFWDRTWEFMPDTLRLAPIFKSTEIRQEKDYYWVNVNIRPARVFVDNTLYIGAFKTLHPAEKPIKTQGGWHLKSESQQIFSTYNTRFDYTDFHAGDTVYFGPYYVMDGWGGIWFNLATENDMRIIKSYLNCDMKNDTVAIPSCPNPLYDTYVTELITNCPYKSISTFDWVDVMDSVKLIQDPEDWTKIKLMMYPGINKSFFAGRRLCNFEIYAMSDIDAKWPFYETFSIYFDQAPNDLQNIYASASARFHDSNGYEYMLSFDKAKVTMERIDKDNVTLEAVNTSIDDDGIIKNQFLKMKIRKTGKDISGDTFISEGSMRNETIVGDVVVSSDEIEFQDTPNCIGYWINADGKTIVSGNHFELDQDDDGNDVPTTYPLVVQDNNNISVYFYFERE